VFVADSMNDRIQVLTPRFDFFAFVGVDQLKGPTGVCADNDTVFVCEREADRISVFSRSEGALLRRFGSQGSDDGQLNSPTALCFMNRTRHIAVAEYHNHRISVFTLEGVFVRHVGADKLAHPHGVACSEFDELVVADYNGLDRRRGVYAFTASGELLREVKCGASSGIAIHGEGIFALTWLEKQCVTIL
jgi:DNA-binding beta-propeller fold protein YncE